MNSIEQHFGTEEADSTGWIFTDMIMNIVAVLILVAFAFSINMNEDIRGKLFSLREAPEGLVALAYEDSFLNAQLLDPSEIEGGEGVSFGLDDTENAAQGDILEITGQGGESPHMGELPDFGDLPGFDERIDEETYEIRGNDPNLIGEIGKEEGAISDFKDGLEKGMDTSKNAFVGSDYSSEGIIGNTIYVLSRKSPFGELYNLHVNLLPSGQLEIEGKRYSARAVQNLINTKAGEYAVYVHLHVGRDVDFATYEDIKDKLWDRTFAARFHSLAKTID